jgi:titin
MGQYGERHNLPTTRKTKTWYHKVFEFFGKPYSSAGSTRRPRPGYRLLVEPLEDRLAPATTFTVNSLGDSNTGIAATHMGTLRWVINQANAGMTGTGTTPDTINFSVAGTISVGNIGLGALPALVDEATIDGTTAPGWTGIPVVILDGTSAGAAANGLTLSGLNPTIAGLDIINFTGNGIQVDTTSGGALIIQNWIGVTTAGVVAANAKDGIFINDTLGNEIGYPKGGLGNVISGNTGSGVDIAGTAATGNLVAGNSIGTNAAGTAALGNIVDGVRIKGGASNNTIGGTAAGAGNLISGNGFGGVSANGVGIYNTGSSGNLIEGNTIGADVTGSKDIDTAYADVFIGYGAASNTVGGAAAGTGNLLTSAFQAGVFIFGNNKTGTSGNLIEGNTIGLLASGTAKSINPFGIELTNGASNNTIGGTTAGAGNLIAASTLDGIEIDTAGTSGNLVEGNTIGTNATSSTATFLQNGWAGIFVGYGSTNNTIGGVGLGDGNLLSNNFETGLEIFEIDSTGNVVQGNKIGTDSTGASTVANGVNGIFLLDTSLNTIGGTAAGTTKGNLISGNKVDGIDLISFNNTLPCSGNVIQGNSIGTQAGGNAALANAWAGIFIGYGAATHNTIGSTAVGAGNLISGNAAIGIELFSSGVTGNVIEGNNIGTNAAVTAKLGNFYGILIAGGASGNTIGGAAGSNVISGNGGDGILFQNSGSATGNLVANNIIGSNTINSGSGLNLGNGGNGVELQAGTGPNVVGSPIPGTLENRIVFNTGQAILDNGTGDNTSNNILT